MASNVHYVNDDGNVNYNDCDWSKDVRPFWSGRRNKVRETLKLESRYQKNKQPFFSYSWKDKYKGIQNIRYKLRL